MLKFYYNGAPNPLKVALFLEEAGLAYEPVPVDTKHGEQHQADFLTLNPNAKVPVIVDGDVTVFDSNAILLYLAEKTGRFLPADTPVMRGELLSWLMFVASGVGPYSGQAVHFRYFPEEPIPYPRNRYRYEARRHWGIVEERLAGRPYMLGDTYTIVDMAVWGWATRIPFMLGDEVMADYPSIQRLMDEIGERPATARALALPTRHTFKAELDDTAKRHLYPQNYTTAP